MKRDLISGLIAFLLTVIVFAGFINIAFALMDYDDDWSPDETSHSEVAGWYQQVGQDYNTQSHKGSITEGNVYRTGQTIFSGYDVTYDEVYSHTFWLTSNYTYKDKGYSEEDIKFIKTYTDSGYSDLVLQSRALAEIGPPGVER